jgi:acetolactate synthase-1/2/3 large subunit
MTGAEILVKTLEMEGVEMVFGYPGGAVLALYDAIFRAEKLKHILTRHEQGAVHAADAYARVTGRPGVVIATSGPGATNLVTGIANAYMDSVPLVAITGQVALDMVGRDSFQEADITGITLPVTKYSYLVKDVKDIVGIVQEAFFLASTGRPGPVVIDFPKDIAAAKTEFYYPIAPNVPGYRIPKNGNSQQIKQAARLLAVADRPLIVAGGGVVNAEAAPELLELAKKLGIPVTTTLMAKGVFPENHPLSLGMLGMHGTAYANYAISACDLLLSFGMRFDDRVTANVATFAPKAKIIHIDIDAAEIGKNVRVDIPIVGDAKFVLQQLLQLVEEKDYSVWREQVCCWQEEFPLKYSLDCGSLKPQYVIEQICQLTKGEAIITTDVGQHQMWAAQYYHSYYPRRFITSGGLGTMGFGLPAAVGAQVAKPEALVIDIAGDGSLQMMAQELATIQQYGLPVKIALINNQYLGMVRQWQELFFGRRYSHSDIAAGGPDFVKLADAYGIKAMRVEKPEEVRPALELAINTPEAFLIEFVVEREENVFPMVPAGGSLDKMLGR